MNTKSRIRNFLKILPKIFIFILILTTATEGVFERIYLQRLRDLDDPSQNPAVPPNIRSIRQIRGTKIGNGTVRAANQDVYFWPGLDEREKGVIRSAFEQIHRRTCVRFNELDYKPWYHAERWTEGKPYIIIRKSKKFSGYSDNSIEGVNRRSLIYLSEKALNRSDQRQQGANTTRGIVLDQLLKFMGFREEFLRPDAASYIQPISGSQRPPIPPSLPDFSEEQLMWPFDPESVTIPASARDWFKLTVYCKGRQNSDIGAAQRAGVLTKWDVIKLNSMYCPDQAANADPKMGPCVVPRKTRNINTSDNNNDR